MLISMVLGATCTFMEGSSPWNGSTQMPDFNGEIYTIRTAEELAWIASASRSDDFAGKKIVLADDIDLGGTAVTPPSWEPIGSAGKPFRGEIDGANHVIYNLYMLSSLFPQGAGLIAESGSEAVIHHLGIAQGQIMTDATSNVGSIAGVHRGSIHHCFNMAQIIAHNGDRIGGLVGTNYGRIAYSYNAGIITDGNDHVGGLVGHNQASAVLDNCYNMGYCKGSDHVGALFGKNEAPETQLTKVYFDQQLTRMYATGYGAADAIITDNTIYAIAKSTDFIGKNSPFYQVPETEWHCSSGGTWSHPQLACFQEHPASHVSVKAILLDANELPVERAEGVGAPKEGNSPRQPFGLEPIHHTTYGDGAWYSPTPDVIHIPTPTSDRASVHRPCGNQEVILTLTYDRYVKQVYTLVKGYEAFDAGILNDSYSACWNEEGVLLKAQNKGGKEATGGKDDEQDNGSVSYQYMIIRDTIIGHDENDFPNQFEPIDTFYMSQPAYNEWAMPTDVPGEYAFRRYVHDTKCKTEWTASKGGTGEAEGRFYLYVRRRFEPGDLYEEPDTIYGLPQTLTIQSKRDASGGGEMFEYVWKMEHAVLDTASQSWKKVEEDTREPLYIGATKVSTASFEYLFTEAGEYTFYRKVSEKTCHALPQECEHAHKVVVYNAINPGSIDRYERESCSAVCTDTIRETSRVSGGNGVYTYRWTCNGVPIVDSDTTELELGGMILVPGQSYLFRRQVKDTIGLTDWITSDGEVRITVLLPNDSCIALCSKKETKVVTICENDLPYTYQYQYADGHEEEFLFSYDGEALTAHDLTEEGCPYEVTIVCHTTPTPEVEVQPHVSVCQTEGNLAMTFTILEGSPDRFDVRFSERAKEAGCLDIEGAVLPSDGMIRIPLPEGMALGQYAFSVFFYASMGSDGCKGSPRTVTFSLDLDGYVFRKGEDVLFVDNSGLHTEEGLTFTAYRWYKNGSLIEGEEGQFYYEHPGLNGYYQVEMTTADGTVYHSCLYEMRTAEGIENSNVQGDNVQCTKVLLGGQLYLMYEGRMYDVRGRVVGPHPASP